MTSEGMTTAVALDKVNSVNAQRPDVVVVAFGLDDVERGATIEQIYSNLIDIVGRIRQSGAYVVLAGIKAPPTLGYNYVKQFDNIYNLVASARGAMLVPDIMLGVVDNPQMTLADGMHPNSRGVEIMVENSYRYVDTCLRTKIQAEQYQQNYKAYQNQLLQQQGR